MVAEMVLEGAKDLAPLLQLAAKNFGDHVPWWRGQADKDWGLIAPIHRDTDGRHPRFEMNICQRFFAQAKVRRHDCPTDDDPVGWLFLMQHFGMKTRLLDWTEGLLIAVFFAVYNKNFDDRDGVVWAMHPTRFNAAYGSPEMGVAASKSRSVVQSAFKALTGNGEPPMKASALNPQHSDLRMMIQHARATIHDDGIAIEQHAEAERFLCRGIIPAERKEIWRELLSRFGIDITTLFPDLETLAKALNDTVLAQDP